MLLRIKFISVGEEKLKYEFEKQEKDLVVSYLYKLIIKKKKKSPISVQRQELDSETILVERSIPIARTSFLITVSTERNKVSLEEVTDSRSGAGKVQRKSGISCCARNKQVLKNLLEYIKIKYKAAQNNPH